MSTEELSENASKPAPDVSATEAMLRDAQGMLQRAWEDPEALGESSKICIQATRLFDFIRQHATPDEETDMFVDALRLSWLAVWRTRDYSLQGLERRSREQDWPMTQRIGASDPYNRVQEYQGARWFPMHYPVFDSDGELIPSTVSRSSLTEYLHRPHANIWEGAMLVDARQLQGMPKNTLRWSWVKILLPTKDGPWSLNDCVIDSEPAASDCQGGVLPSCQNAIFLPHTEFSSFAAKNLDALKGSRFESGLALRNGVFTEDVDVPAIQTNGDLELDKVRCEEGFFLTAMRFGVRSIVGKNWRVSGTTRLRPANRLSLCWKEEQNQGMGGVDAAQAKFSKLELTGLKMSGVAQFTGADADENVAVLNCYFSRGAFFNRAVLGRSGKFTLVTFKNCEFHQAAEFRQTIFGTFLSFNDAKFQIADFRGAKFRNAASFMGTAFEVELKMSKFEGDPVIFEGDVDFRGAGEDGPSSIFSVVDFSGAHFRSRANFRNRIFTDDTSFNDSTFSYPPSFHGSKFHPRTTFSRASFPWREARPSNRLQRTITVRWNAWRGKPPGSAITNDNDLLTEVSDSFRVLTTLSRQIDAPELAYRFHREELRGRHHRAILGGVSRAEAVIGRLYGAVADYGDNFLRPVLGLLASLALFACAYNSMAFHGSDRGLAAVVISGSIQLKPFSHLDAAFGRIPTNEQRVVCVHQLQGRETVSTACLSAHLVDEHELQFKALATGQSILSVALIFLAALGLRRKYQIG